MKTSLLNFALLFGLASGCALADNGPATKSWFVRPEAGYLVFGNSKYDGEASYGLVAGAFLDDEGNHELALEWAYSKVKYTDEPAAGVVGGATTRLDGHLSPLLLGYRYRIRVADTVRVAVGPSLGVSMLREDMTYSTPSMANGEFTGSGSKRALSLGGGVGCEWSVTPAFGVQVGYRYLHVNKLGDIVGTRAVDSVEETGTFGALNTHLVYGALTFSF